MKKILLALTLVFGFMSAAQAQFTFGPKVGISSTKLKIKDNISAIQAKDADFGFSAGLFTRVSIGDFFIQPEAMFSSQRGRLELTDDSQGFGKQVVDLEYNRLDVPVMFGTEMFGFLRVQAGPVVNFILSKDVKTGADDFDFQSEFNNSVIGYQAGLGVDIGKVTLDVRWEGNLSALGQNVKFLGKNFDTDVRDRQLTFAVGIKFL